MRVAVDTNRLTDLFLGDTELAEFLEVCDEVLIPLIVLAEIKAGFLGGDRHQHNEAILAKLLAKPRFKVLVPSRETADHFAKLFVQLKRAGRPLPDNDIWIAALALEHDLTLVTRDQHFDRIPQLIRG